MDAIFKTLRGVMASHTKGLPLRTDTPDMFYADTYHIGPNKRLLFFGSVQIRKRYVSYHLMAVYTHTELLEGMSDGLRKRMQGKSCFNFSRPDPDLFQELDTLTGRCREVYDKAGYLTPA